MASYSNTPFSNAKTFELNRLWLMEMIYDAGYTQKKLTPAYKLENLFSSIETELFDVLRIQDNDDYDINDEMTDFLENIKEHDEIGDAFKALYH